MHLTLVPYIAAAGELKTKPTQHSVKELRSIGIQPDILVCRSEKPLPDGERRKIALFTNVPEKAVISCVDVDNIYKLPLWLHSQGLDEIAVERLRLEDKARAADLSEWEAVVDAVEHPVDEVTVAVVGKYIDHQDAYKSLSEALKHGGLRQRTRVKLKWLESEQVEKDGTGVLAGVDAILVPGGFGDRGFEGKVLTAKHARENGIPYFGICYGLHMAVIEVARDLCGLDRANSSEIEGESPHPVIDIMPDQRGVEMGGTMRLGLWPCRLEPGTIAAEAYGEPSVNERHRHRFEVNNAYRERLARAGLIASGVSPDGRLVEIMELRDHRFFVGVQFHPEFRSRPTRPHPIFRAFVGAALDYLPEGAQRTLPLNGAVPSDDDGAGSPLLASTPA
jgi:CTP synthase